MKAKKIFAVLCACAIAMFAFTACGGNNGENTESTTAAASTTDTADDNTTENADGSSSSQSVSFTGTYSPETITDADGNEMTYDEYVAQAAVSQGYEEGTDEYNSFIASSEASYLFSDDGTVTAKMGDEENSGTYVFDGASSLTTTFDGVDTVYTYDADKETLTASDADSGITIVMTKV